MHLILKIEIKTTKSVSCELQLRRGNHESHGRACLQWWCEGSVVVVRLKLRYHTTNCDARSTNCKRRSFNDDMIPTASTTLEKDKTLIYSVKISDINNATDRRCSVNTRPTKKFLTTNPQIIITQCSNVINFNGRVTLLLHTFKIFQC